MHTHAHTTNTHTHAHAHAHSRHRVGLMSEGKPESCMGVLDGETAAGAQERFERMKVSLSLSLSLSRARALSLSQELGVY